MRIVHITINTIELERRILNQAQTTESAGHDVWIVAAGRKGDKSREKLQRIMLRRLHSPFASGPFRFLYFNMRVFCWLFWRPMTVIHCHDLWVLPAAALAALFKNVVLIYDAHEYYAGLEIFNKRSLRRKFWLFFERLNIPLVDTLITVSEPLAELYRKRYHRLKSACVIRNLPAYEKMEVNVRKRQEKIICFHGYFKPGRGLENLIRAMANVRDARLQLTGGGELKSSLQELVAQLNLQNRVEFLDYIPTADLIGYIAQADIGAVLFEPTSVNYSFALPNKFFEFIMAGLPVLASNIETFEYYIEKYKVGLTVDPGNPEAIGNALNQMLSDEQHLLQWRQNALAAAKELNWENEAPRLMEIYERTCI